MANFIHLLTVPSGSPVNFTAEAVSLHNFNLTWAPPVPEDRNGVITGYNISISLLSSPFGDPLQFDTTAHTVRVESLSPHTDYVCVIAANTLIGTGPLSFELHVRTLQDSKL